MELLDMSKIANFSEEILKISKVHGENMQLLNSMYYENCDLKALRATIHNVIKHYNEVIYLYKFSNKNSKVTSPSWKQTKVKSTKIQDIVGKTIETQVDELIWATEFYNRILCLAKKLTVYEAEYFVGTFLRNKTEDILCEKLNVCRNTLRKIKKSCLIKTLIEISDLM